MPWFLWAVAMMEPCLSIKRIPDLFWGEEREMWNWLCTPLSLTFIFLFYFHSPSLSSCYISLRPLTYHLSICSVRGRSQLRKWTSFLRELIQQPLVTKARISTSCLEPPHWQPLGRWLPHGSVMWSWANPHGPQSESLNKSVKMERRESILRMFPNQTSHLVTDQL